MRTALFDRVCVGFLGMGAQVVSKCNVTFHMRRVCFEEMKLHDTNTGLIGKCAITPSRDTEFAVPPISERFNVLTLPVKAGQAGLRRASNQ